MKIIYRILDISIFSLLILRFIIWAGATYLYNNHLKPGRKKPQTRKSLSFSGTSYATYLERGLGFRFENDNPKHYFDLSYAVHAFTTHTQTVKASDNLIMMDYGTERYPRSGILGSKYTRDAVILWDFFHFFVNLIEGEDIDLIEGNEPFTNGLIAMICSRLTHTPFCIHVRRVYDLLTTAAGPEYFPAVLGSHRLAKLVQRLVLSHCDMVIPLSEARGKYAIKHGAKPERIRVIPREIDLSKFPQPSPTLKKELGVEGKKVISFVGRLVKINYVADIIQVASKVCPRSGDAVFLMVGDGEERESLEELTHSLMLDDRVRFLGMQVWQKAMQIRLISNVSLCLQAGNSLVEAAVAATPLIAYDVDWHYELVKNNETGFLLPERDIDEVAEAIIKLLDEPELARRMGQNARKLATERHSIEKVRQIKIDFYEELIQRAR